MNYQPERNQMSKAMTPELTEAEKVAKIARFGFDKPEVDETPVSF